MKKTNTKAQETKTEVKDLFASILNDTTEVIQGATKNKKGNMTTYELSEGVLLRIVSTDGDRDLGSLSIYGVSINLSFGISEKGAYVLYPSYKTKDGEFKQLVTNYSKSLNNLIKEILKAHYEL